MLRNLLFGIVLLFSLISVADEWTAWRWSTTNKRKQTTLTRTFYQKNGEKCVSQATIFEKEGRYGVSIAAAGLIKSTHQYHFKKDATLDDVSGYVEENHKTIALDFCGRFPKQKAKPKSAIAEVAWRNSVNSPSKNKAASSRYRPVPTPTSTLSFTGQSHSSSSAPGWDPNPKNGNFITNRQLGNCVIGGTVFWTSIDNKLVWRSVWDRYEQQTDGQIVKDLVGNFDNTDFHEATDAISRAERNFLNLLLINPVLHDMCCAYGACR